MLLLNDQDVIYDSDVDALIFKALLDLRRPGLDTFVLAAERLLDLRIVCKDMIREQISKAQSGDLDLFDSLLDAEIWTRWLRPVAQAFNWRLEEPAGN
jgi:hypothetical protein